MCDLTSNKMSYDCIVGNGNINYNFLLKHWTFVLYASSCFFFLKVANTDPTNSKKIITNLCLEMFVCVEECKYYWLFYH